MATIARAVGMTSTALSRLLELREAREIISFLFELCAPEQLGPDFQVTDPYSTPPALLRLHEARPVPLPPPVVDHRQSSPFDLLKQSKATQKRSEDDSDA